MKLIVIGSVASGTSVAAKARRNDENLEIKIFDKDRDISYSSCGLPYFIGEDYIERGNLTPRNSKWFKKRFNIDIFTEHEVLSIDKDNKKIMVKNLSTQEIFEETYDKLVLATGSSPIELNIPSDSSIDILKLKNVQDADKIREHINNSKLKKALIIGGGYIGLELCENLKKQGLDVVIVEKGNQLSPNLDIEVAQYVENYLIKNNIDIRKNTMVNEVRENIVYLDDDTNLTVDFIVSAVGVKANNSLGKAIDMEIGASGAYVVDKHLKTSINDIYAVGDCALSYSKITGEKIYVPLGSTANKMGRICGDHITGGSLEFEGILGTGIYKFFDLAVAQTGLTEKKALALEYDIEIIHNLKPNQTEYLNTSREMLIKAIADKKTGRLLGAQIVGENGVDKRIDVIATIINYSGKVEDLFQIDLAYAPPFSTTKDPIAYTGMILTNSIYGKNPIITYKELIKNREQYTIIDVRSQEQYNNSHIEGAINIPLGNIREKYKELDKSLTYVVHCNKGVSGNAAQNLLRNLGFEKVYNLSGGFKESKIESKIWK